MTATIEATTKALALLAGAPHTNKPHDCLDHIRHREYTSTEPHGEVHTDERYECAWPGCGNWYTPEELDREYTARPVGERAEDEIERARRRALLEEGKRR